MSISTIFYVSGIHILISQSFSMKSWLDLPTWSAHYADVGCLCSWLWSICTITKRLREKKGATKYYHRVSIGGWKNVGQPKQQVYLGDFLLFSCFNYISLTFLQLRYTHFEMGFPGANCNGKESACHAGDARMAGHMCTHGWFMSMYGKNHHNIIK